MSTPTSGSRVQMRYGTIAEYNTIQNKDVNTFYIITDTQQVFVGDTEYTRYVQVIESASDEVTAPPNSFVILIDDSTDPATTVLYFWDGENKTVVTTGGSGTPVGTEGDYGLGADTTATFGSTAQIPLLTINSAGMLSSVSANTLTMPSLPNVGTQGSYGLGSDTTATYDGSFNIPVITLDSNGNVSSVSQHALTMPSAGSGYLPVNNPSYTGSITGANNSVNSNPANIIGARNYIGSASSSAEIDLTNIIGDDNSVYNPTTSSSHTYTTILGDHNTAKISGTSNRGNFVSGTGNTVDLIGGNNSAVGVFGYNNNVYADSQVGTLVFGQGQEVTATYFGNSGNVIGGLRNVVDFDHFSQDNFIFGDSNTVNTDYDIHNNTIFGRSNKVLADSANSREIQSTDVVLFGQQNTISSANQAIQLQHANIFGNGNNVLGSVIGSTIIGEQNAFGNTLTNTYILGHGNDTTSGQGITLEDTYIFGKLNSFQTGATTTATYVLGNSNTLNQGAVEENLILGSENVFTFGGATSSTVLGKSNQIQYNVSNVNIFGSHNTCGASDKTILGDYSDTTDTTERFVFGMGSSSGGNDNAFSIGFDSTASDYFVKLGDTQLTETQLISIIQGGGGGSTTLAGLTDVTITTPSNGQSLIYDSTSSKWINGTPSGSSYSSAYISNCVTSLAYIPDGDSSKSIASLNIIVKSTSGVTSASIIQHGKNFCDPNNYEIGSISENQVIGTPYSQMKTAYLNRGRVVNLIQILPLMRISWDSNYAIGLAQFDKDGNYLGVATFAAWLTAYSGYDIPLVDGAEYIAIIFKRTDEGNISSSDFEAINIQLEVGTTTTTFEAYNPTTYTVSFPASVGNVNYATLDIVSGKLNVLIGSGTLGQVDCGATTITPYNGINAFISTYKIEECHY